MRRASLAAAVEMFGIGFPSETAVKAATVATLGALKAGAAQRTPEPVLKGPGVHTGWVDGSICQPESLGAVKDVLADDGWRDYAQGVASRVDFVHGYSTDHVDAPY